VSKIAKDQGYFLIRIHAAQASYKGTFWQNLRNAAKQVLVTSEVQLKPWIDDPLPQIQAARRIRPKQAVQLGLRSNLIDFIPATMDKISIKLGLVLDQKDRLEALSSAINGSGFLSTISLAEPTPATVKALGSASRAVLDAFLEAESKKPILEFAGDFNIGTSDLQAGYYVLLGTTDNDAPLPSNDSRWTVSGTKLLVDGKSTDQWSYVILEVMCSEARGRNQQAKWNKPLSEAEAQADQIGRLQKPTKDQRSAALEKCQNLITDADTLIRGDPNYLPEEAKKIIADSFRYCRDAILTEAAQRGTAVMAVAEPWFDQTRHLLGLGADNDINQAVISYADQVEALREIERQRAQKDQESEAIRRTVDSEDRSLAAAS
jgi:hypothetical protein